MINNYILSLRCCEKETILKHHSEIYDLFKAVYRENIVLLFDYEINSFKKLVNQIRNIDDREINYRKKDLLTFVEYIYSSKDKPGYVKYFCFNFKFEKNKTKEFINQIISQNVAIDALVTDEKEKNTIEGLKIIKLGDFKYSHVEKKREKLFSEGIIDLHEKGKKITGQYISKALWNSNNISYFDLHLQNALNKSREFPQILMEWERSFKFLFEIFLTCKTKINNKINISIYTPNPKPKGFQRANLDKFHDECSKTIFNFFKGYEKSINLSLYFVDDRQEGEGYYHDRFLEFKSCKLGVGRGADLINADNEIKFGSFVKHENLPFKFFNQMKNFQKKEYFYPKKTF